MPSATQWATINSKEMGSADEAPSSQSPSSSDPSNPNKMTWAGAKKHFCKEYEAKFPSFKKPEIPKKLAMKFRILDAIRREGPQKTTELYADIEDKFVELKIWMHGNHEYQIIEHYTWQNTVRQQTSSEKIWTIIKGSNGSKHELTNSEGIVLKDPKFWDGKQALTVKKLKEDKKGYNLFFQDKGTKKWHINQKVDVTATLKEYSTALAEYEKLEKRTTIQQLVHPDHHDTPGMSDDDIKKARLKIVNQYRPPTKSNGNTIGSEDDEQADSVTNSANQSQSVATSTTVNGHNNRSSPPINTIYSISPANSLSSSTESNPALEQVEASAKPEARRRRSESWFTIVMNNPPPKRRGPRSQKSSVTKRARTSRRPASQTATPKPSARSDTVQASQTEAPNPRALTNPDFLEVESPTTQPRGRTDATVGGNNPHVAPAWMAFSPRLAPIDPTRATTHLPPLRTMDYFNVDYDPASAPRQFKQSNIRTLLN